MNDLHKLQEVWATIDAKIDRNWQLNLALIKESKLDKIKHQLLRLIWVKGITVFFYAVFAYLFIYTAVLNWGHLSLFISSIILAIWTITIMSTSIHELQLITQLDYAKPVTQLQKDLSHLRLVIIRYLRLGVWIFPFYLCFIIQAFYWFWGIDTLTTLNQNWLIGQLAFSLFIMLPFAIWATRKLHVKNAEENWMNYLLSGNGSQIKASLLLLDELKAIDEYH